MFSQAMIIGAVVLVCMTSIYILASKDWRYSIAALALQYGGIFLLVGAFSSVEVAATKMVAGWMAGAILGVAMASGSDTLRETEHKRRISPLFRLMAASIMGLTVTSLVMNQEGTLSMIRTEIRWGSFFLIGIGLLQMSLISQPLRVIIGLLTLLSGFEIIYAVIETSVLVTGLLAGINLGLALVGAYILLAPSMEPAV